MKYKIPSLLCHNSIFNATCKNGSLAEAEGSTFTICSETGGSNLGQTCEPGNTDKTNYWNCSDGTNFVPGTDCSDGSYAGRSFCGTGGDITN